MLALSIQQPWAWLIVNGIKPVENRNWPTRVRGGILIHAGKKIDMGSYDWIEGNYDCKLPDPNALERGGIVGKATLINCVTDHESAWFFGKFGFVFKDATPLPFKPLRGQLGFFNVEWDNN